MDRTGLETYDRQIVTHENRTEDIGDSNFEIAYIKPIFTETAYYKYGFYVFYRKHHDTNSAEVTTDLDLLKPKIYYSEKLTDKISDLLDHIQNINNSTNVTVLTDIDLDTYDDNILLRGKDSAMKKYDVVILDHQEYVTQREYDVLKEYVANGGTLIALNANILYAEVRYDSASNTMQLVKGHDWEFDGKSAKKSVKERWAEETSLWLGSNFLCYSCKISFGNNPFGYIHSEEQYITNPNARVIVDYNATVDNASLYGSDKMVIATYYLDYQMGRSIVLGIYGEQVADNEAFQKFFVSLLTDYAGMPT